jgi:hypothetical protein
MISTEFQELADLMDGNLQLVVKARDPAIPEKGWVRAHRLAIVVDGSLVGTIDRCRTGAGCECTTCLA